MCSPLPEHFAYPYLRAADNDGRHRLCVVVAAVRLMIFRNTE